MRWLIHPSRPHLLTAAVAVFLLIIGWMLNTPAGLLGKADAVGYAVCHQIDVRSFSIGDRPISLCARCTGMYLGAMLALGWLAIFRRARSDNPPWIVIGIGAALVGAFGVDGVNSLANLIPEIPALYPSSNTLRVLTGTGMGLVMGSAVFLAFNQTVWATRDAQPVLGSVRDAGALIGLGLVGVALALSGNPLILYPLTLISATGVLVLLTMIYSLVILLLSRQDNQIQTWKQLTLPLSGGLFLAMLQVAGLDLIRFWLTGTWEGFHVFLG